MATVLSPLSGAAPTGFLIKAAGGEIALAQVDGIANVTLVANATIAATEIDIWPENAALVLPALAGSSFEVVSTDPADDAVGTGAQEVTVTLLDTAFVRSTQVIDTDGAVAVAVPGGPYVMCESSIVTAVGVGRTNAGVIRTQVAAGGNVQNHIPVGAFRSQQMFFGVAADEQAILFQLDARRNNSTATIIRVREDGAAGTGIIAVTNAGLFDEVDLTLQNGILIGSSNRVRVTADFASGATNGISGFVTVVRVDNTLT